MSNPRKIRPGENENDPRYSDSESQDAKRHAAIAAVRDFLSQNAEEVQRLRHCKACGATMEYIDAYFWLDGTDVASLVPLPFCPACDPDVLTSLRRKRTAASELAS